MHERYSLQREAERAVYESHSESEAAQADEMQDGRLPLSSQKAVGEGSAVSQWEETQSFWGLC